MAVEIFAPQGSAVAVSVPHSAVAESPVYTTDVVADITTMPSYKGSYEVTPGQNAQVLPTDGLMMSGDVTIGAIPSNYGLITYNGSVITVS